MSDVSCIILNYNDSSTTIGLLKLIYKFKNINHIIVVDNNSSDNSYDVLKKFEDQHIDVIRSDKNGGYGYGNNFGMKFAKSKYNPSYFIIANPDVIFKESTVAKFIDFLDKNQEFAAVSCLQYGNNTPAWKNVNLFNDQLFNSIILNKLFKPRYYNNSYFKKIVCEVFAIPGCFFMIRAKSMDECGYYDEDFFLFEEEKVLATKLANIGMKTAILTNDEYIHNHSVTMKKNYKKMYKAKRIVLNSNEIYIKKYLKISEIKMKMVKIYHKYCLVESVIYGLFKNWKG